MKKKDRNFAKSNGRNLAKKENLKRKRNLKRTDDFPPKPEIPRNVDYLRNKQPFRQRRKQCRFRQKKVQVQSKFPSLSFSSVCLMSGALLFIIGLCITLQTYFYI